MALWFAEHFPKATVRGVSNSNSQREWIMARAAERGLTNLKIYTGNIVRAQPHVQHTTGARCCLASPPEFICSATR